MIIVVFKNLFGVDCLGIRYLYYIFFLLGLGKIVEDSVKYILVYGSIFRRVYEEYRLELANYL